MTFKEKALTYEETLAEARRAYIQLEETYKTMVERIQAEKIGSLK